MARRKNFDLTVEDLNDESQKELIEKGKALRAKLKEFRKEKGWGQEKVAEKLHVSPRQVSRWENEEAIPGEESQKRLDALYAGIRIVTPEEREELSFALIRQNNKMLKKIVSVLGLDTADIDAPEMDVDAVDPTHEPGTIGTSSV